MLSERARLLLERQEGIDVEFKRVRSAIDPEDVVAFANSKGGGAILVGVDDTTNATGRQVGKVVGCTVSDREKLAILQVGLSCTPAVEIEVHEEALGEQNCYRLEVPSGPSKPYCTGKGTYTIRGDGRNLALQPPQLLALYMDVEGTQFLERFRAATKSVSDGIELLEDRIADLGGQTTEQLEKVFEGAQGAADDALQISSDLNDAVGTLEERIGVVEGMAAYNSSMLEALLAHFGLENPRTTYRRRIVYDLAKGMWPSLKDRAKIAEILRSSMDQADLAPGTIEAWVDEALVQLPSDEPMDRAERHE